jgi:sugar/nucleoside kinase (ribokinase family)
MNLWIRTTPTELNEIISRTNILLINESELREYTGINEVRAGAKKILLTGPEKVVVKLGGKGAICIDQDQEVKTGVYPVHKVLDPTGAGDVFGGGFISGLSEGLPIIDAMRRGTALASFCIEDFGVSMLDNITKDDIDHRIFELEN